MKIGIYTLGCKVNQYETQAMQQLLLARGDTLGEFDGVCDECAARLAQTMPGNIKLRSNLADSHSDM